MCASVVPFLFLVMTEIEFIQFLLESLKINEAELSVVYCKFQEVGTSNIVLHIETNSGTQITEAIKKVNNEIFDYKKQKLVQANEFGLKVKSNKVYTYLMKDQRNDTYKIGKSNNPEFREKTLQSEVPQVILLSYCEEQIISEKLLHQLFEDKRIRGEWFALDANDVNRIIKLMNKYEYCNLSNTNRRSKIDSSEELVINSILEVFKTNEFIKQQNLVSELVKITNLGDTTLRRRLLKIVDNQIIIADANNQKYNLVYYQQCSGKATIYKLQPIQL